MTNVLICCFILLTTVAAFGQTATAPKIRKVQMSTEAAELRDKLRTDKSVLEIACGLFEPIDPKGSAAETKLRAQTENSRIRLLLYRASQTADQTVKAKYTCTGAEREDNFYYLLVENGQVRYMGDYTQERTGVLRLDITECDKLKLGTLVSKEPGAALEFVPVTDEKYDGKVLILQCQAGKKSFIF